MQGITNSTRQIAVKIPGIMQRLAAQTFHFQPHDSALAKAAKAQTLKQNHAYRLQRLSN
jgi:hypothetical protein